MKEVNFITPEEFSESGALWWINRQLHLFGLAVYRVKNDDGSEELRAGYSNESGFNRAEEEAGFARMRSGIKS